MPDQLDFNFEEAIHGVLEAKTALGRAQTSMERLERMLSEQPRSFGPLAEPAFRLRDRLIEDLGTLDAALARVDAAPDPSASSAPVDEDLAEAGAPKAGGPLGDAMSLGGQ